MVDIILGGSSAQVLVIKVGRLLKASVLLPEIKRFPDGEKYVRITGNVNGKTVAVIQSFYHQPDEFLIEYFLMVDTLKDLGAKRVLGVVPYFAYARQDERFKPGEAVSFKIVTKLIEVVGTDEIYTVDTHLHRVEQLSEIFRIPAHNLTAVPLLAQYIKKNFELTNPIVIGPDEEAEQWAKVAAKELEAEYDVLEKERLGPSEVRIKTRELDVKNRDIVIVDDIISTGGTMVEAIKMLKEHGAKNIIAACTHPILVQNALTKIYQAGALAVIGTDTVPSSISFVSVAPVMAEALR
ncbi:MAG: ribose-phosphate diphosphokinase [Candidatus Baldrarchaeota archaeon]